MAMTQVDAAEHNSEVSRIWKIQSLTGGENFLFISLTCHFQFPYFHSRATPHCNVADCIYIRFCSVLQITEYCVCTDDQTRTAAPYLYKGKYLVLLNLTSIKPSCPQYHFHW